MLIEDYLDSVVNKIQVRPDGEATGDCPLCGKTRDHFYVHVGHDIDSRGRSRHGRWICFSCGEYGDFWRLLGELEGMSPARAKAWWIAQGRETKPATTVDKVRDRLSALVRRSQTGFKVEIGLPMGFNRIKRRRPLVLAQRGVSLATARRYGLGYANEGEAAGRIIFPVRCPLGHSWTARAVNDDTSPKYFAGEGAGRLLFGWDVAFSGEPPRELVVCEGPMDVLSLAEAGITAVAVMSKSINEERATLLRRSGVTLVVALDSEAQSEALRVSEALGHVPLVLLDSGDPGDTPPKVLIAAVQGKLEALNAACKVYRNKVKDLRRRNSL